MTLESTPRIYSLEHTFAGCDLRAECNSIHRSVARIRFGPHRSESFKLSKDPLFIDKVTRYCWALHGFLRIKPGTCVCENLRFSFGSLAAHLPCAPDKRNAGS